MKAPGNRYGRSSFVPISTLNEYMTAPVIIMPIRLPTTPSIRASDITRIPSLFLDTPITLRAANSLFLSPVMI